jgi:hypothetical protein
MSDLCQAQAGDVICERELSHGGPHRAMYFILEAHAIRLYEWTDEDAAEINTAGRPSEYA